MRTNRTITTFRDGDETKVFELWKAVYPETGHDAWLSWWRWSHEKNPAGRGKTWLMEENGRVLGQYRLLPMDVKVRDKVLKVAQGVNAMTHPNYRHHGINRTLIRHALDEAGKAGFDIAIAFPYSGSASYAAHIRSGWFHFGTMGQFFKALNWNSMIKSKVKSSRLATALAMGAPLLFAGTLATPRRPVGTEGLILKQVASFDDRINGLWARVRDRYMAIVGRSENYLNWRYAAPGHSYRIFVAEKGNDIVGYVVTGFRRAHRITMAYIFDLLAQSDEAMQTLISKAVEDSRLNNADAILSRLIADRSYRAILNRSGFASLPFVKSLAFVACCTSSSISKDFLGDPDNWLIQIGDTDMK